MTPYKKYNLQKFKHDVKMLPIAPSRYPDLFFGGKAWETCKQDLHDIPKHYRVVFILYLFQIVTSDLIMHYYFRKYYPKYKERTNTPKFGLWQNGWKNLQNPFYLIKRPESLEIVPVHSFSRHIPTMVEDWFNTIEAYFAENLPGISYLDFFKHLLSDPHLMRRYERKRFRYHSKQLSKSYNNIIEEIEQVYHLKQNENN